MTKPDLTAYAYLQKRASTVVAITFDRSSMTIETVDSSRTTSRLSCHRLAVWRIEYGFESLNGPRLAPNADLSKYECLLNCGIENVGTAILAEFVKPLSGAAKHWPPASITSPL